MDSDNLIVTDGLETAHQNGLNEQYIVSEEENFLPDNANGNIEKAMADDTDLQNGNLESIYAGELKEGSNECAQSNGLTVSMEGEVKGADNLKKSKPQDKCKNEKPFGSKNVSSSLVKKSKDGTSAEVTSTSSNGSDARTMLQKQPLKSKSFNDRQAAKQSEKPDAAMPEGVKENTGLKPLRKAPIDKAEGVAQSSPTAEDAKPQRVGGLPNYGFSFKCDERAEKRREFYSKLEEKIHARELERSNLQAKSKETQEAEIKMLRKSLNFKATPMPSFYQEPPPPKVELKKIPTTRAKSPKLGRRKSSTPADSETNISNSCPSGRLSLDETTCLSNPTKGISPVHSKKPQRKSLPKLPSERVRLSGATKPEKTPSKTKNGAKTPSVKAANEGKTKSDSTNEENTTLSGVTDEGASAVQEQEPVLSTAESRVTHLDEGPEIEEHTQLDLKPEPIELQQ
ncbi:hypothetical protein SLE2022_035180 [Rubroshorea leprosula]